MVHSFDLYPLVTKMMNVSRRKVGIAMSGTMTIVSFRHIKVILFVYTYRKFKTKQRANYFRCSNHPTFLND